MAINPTALALENRNCGPKGERTLGPACELMRDQWRSGERERELALHLFFMASYINVEPAHLTGRNENRIPRAELESVSAEVHAWLLPDGAATDDAEALYVVGLPASMFPWELSLDHSRLWSDRAELYRARYRQLRPNGLDPAIFSGRGAYGEYYEGQVQVVRGF